LGCKLHGYLEIVMGKCLILGGAGFLGSNLAQKLVAEGETVRIFTRPGSSTSNIQHILDRVELIYRDFMDDVALRNATQNIDTVYHLISTTFPSMTMESSVYDLMSNLLPTIRLVEACLANGVRKIIYASSGGTVYGKPALLPIPQEHPLVPTSAYGQSKLTIENYRNFYARSTSLDISVLRIANPFGPSQKMLGVQGIVAVAMGCAYYGRPLNVYGEGKAVRDYIYVDDVIDAVFLAAAHSGSSVVNISSAVGSSVMDIVRAVEEISGRTIVKRFIPDRPGDVEVNVLDNCKAKQLYGWSPKTTLREGLRKTWEHISQGPPA
jgi:UDP-glucose 4-epimerase